MDKTERTLRIQIIDTEIAKLSAEKEALIMADMREQSIVERLRIISNMESFNRPGSIRQPFFEYHKKFKEQEGRDYLTIDDAYGKYCDRHEILTIESIVEELLEDAGIENPEEETEKTVCIFTERTYDHEFRIPVMEALEHLEKWAIENKVSSWEIDW